MTTQLTSLDRQVLTHALFRLFPLWKLNSRDAARLMNISRRTLARYRRRESIPARRDRIERAITLIQVNKDLSILLGKDNVLLWLKNINTFFKQTPLSKMLEGGVGIEEVVLYIRTHHDR